MKRAILEVKRLLNIWPEWIKTGNKWQRFQVKEIKKKAWKFSNLTRSPKVFSFLHRIAPESISLKGKKSKNTTIQISISGTDRIAQAESWSDFPNANIALRFLATPNPKSFTKRQQQELKNLDNFRGFGKDIHGMVQGGIGYIGISFIQTRNGMLPVISPVQKRMSQISNRLAHTFDGWETAIFKWLFPRLKEAGFSQVVLAVPTFNVGLNPVKSQSAIRRRYTYLAQKHKFREAPIAEIFSPPNPDVQLMNYPQQKVYVKKLN